MSPSHGKWLLVVGALGLAIYGASRWGGAAPPPAFAVAPAFQAATVDGAELRFPEDFRGRIVLLDFWATWCPPCVAELPNVQSAHERFAARGVSVLGVSLDAYHNVSTDELAKFLKDRGLAWPQIYDAEMEIAALYGVSSIPAPLLIDGDTGAVLAHGDELSGARLATTIERHLKR